MGLETCGRCTRHWRPSEPRYGWPAAPTRSWPRKRSCCRGWARSATVWPACIAPGWWNHCGRQSSEASRCWASASACRYCLRRARRWDPTRGWHCFQVAWFDSPSPVPLQRGFPSPLPMQRGFPSPVPLQRGFPSPVSMHRTANQSRSPTLAGIRLSRLGQARYSRGFRGRGLTLTTPTTARHVPSTSWPSPTMAAPSPQSSAGGRWSAPSFTPKRARRPGCIS